MNNQECLIRKSLLLSFSFLTLTIIIISGHCQEKDASPSPEISYRQREFYSQLKYLGEKEKKIVDELNSEITLLNQEPSTVSLQRAEDLKMKIVENLQDQIRSDREYIAYLEKKLSGLLNSDFKAFKVVEDDSGIKQAAERMMEKVDVPAPAAGENP